MKRFDLGKFIAFCRKKGKQGYDPHNICRCALAQFGFPGVCGGDLEGKGISRAVYKTVVRESSFNKLADRLEEL